MVVERVNLREHVVWSHAAKDEDSQMLAEDYLRMGIVKAQKMEPLEPVSEGISKAILVVGGGITGITAALEAAAADYEVVLVEKAAAAWRLPRRHQEAFPHASALHRTWKTHGLAEKIRQVTSHPKIKVYTSTTIAKTEGQPGMFDVTPAERRQTLVHRVGRS